MPKPKVRKMPAQANSSSESSSEPTENREVIPGYTSMEQFTKNGFGVLMEAIKHSNALPGGRDWDFYTTSDSFKRIINDESNSVQRLMNHVMRCNDIESNVRNRVLDEKIELIIEANDIILEKVANNIDELNGIKKSVAAPVVLQTVSAQLPINGSWNRASSATFAVNSKAAESNDRSCIKLITAKNIIRPQKFFKDKIENSNKYPWCPRITDKPNSLKPLAIFLEEFDDRQEYSHPYECELDRFTPTNEQLLEETPTLPRSLSETPLVEINTPEQLDELVETLRHCKEFAVDVEHHSYRSFMGITCLLQISTNEKDYLIDALLLRDKLSILNEVFTKNTIVKIFHGAEKDMEWLQRDLSVYVVNMFDTHQAARILQYQGLSLAFLMKKFCNVLPDKQFQLADWRIRPLPDELKNYAREDTHYLIYIYKMLKKELLAKANKGNNLLKSVIERSTDICKRRYFKPILLDDSYLELYRKFKKMFDNRQLYALKEIYAWRDNLARQEDESLGYVLPNHMLLQISEALPREMQGILACCNPVPPLVRSHLLEIHQIILKAREQPLEKAIKKDTFGRGVLKKVSKVNVDSPLHCPHDLSKTQDFRDDLPTLIQNDKLKTEIEALASINVTIEKSSSYSVFGGSARTDNVFNERETFKKLRGFTYLSPYERYKLVKPFVVAEDEAAQAQKDEENKQVTEANLVQERTDEERIASIRDHFVQLSKKFSEELQVQKQKEEEEEAQKERQRSLLQMGGSRKRKREESYDDGNYAADAAINNNLYNPTPDIKPYRHVGGRNRGKKRKFTEVGDGFNEGPIQPQVHPGQGLPKKNKKNKQKQQQQKQKGEQRQQQQRKRPQRQQRLQQQQQQHQQQNPNFNNQYENNQPQQMPKKKNPNKSNRGGFQQDNTRGGQRQSPKKKRFNQKQGNDHQNTNFAPYDYASVDFRQFQGGAGSANTGVAIQHKFKPKGRKNKNTKGAKSATFGNVKTNRGGNQKRTY